jgi:3-phosphoglycerate kinase
MRIASRERFTLMISCTHTVFWNIPPGISVFQAFWEKNKNMKKAK